MIKIYCDYCGAEISARSRKIKCYFSGVDENGKELASYDYMVESGNICSYCIKKIDLKISELLKNN